YLLWFTVDKLHDIFYNNWTYELKIATSLICEYMLAVREAKEKTTSLLKRSCIKSIEVPTKITKKGFNHSPTHWARLFRLLIFIEHVVFLNEETLVVILKQKAPSTSPNLKILLIMTRSNITGFLVQLCV
ncbi:hypothetical protein ACJX0J_007011, partial [Zea mays]